MSLSPAQLKEYGLKPTDAKSSDHESGIVKDANGNFYQIQGFKREQREGLDTDQGKVFSSSLEKDSGKDFTTFNTATDVEGALQELTGGDDESIEDVLEDLPIELSDTVQSAIDRTETWMDKSTSGKYSDDIYGASNDLAKGITKGKVSGGNNKKGAQSFLEDYKLNLDSKMKAKKNAKVYKASIGTPENTDQDNQEGF